MIQVWASCHAFPYSWANSLDAWSWAQRMSCSAWCLLDFGLWTCSLPQTSSWFKHVRRWNLGYIGRKLNSLMMRWINCGCREESKPGLIFHSIYTWFRNSRNRGKIMTTNNIFVFFRVFLFCFGDTNCATHPLLLILYSEITTQYCTIQDAGNQTLVSCMQDKLST